MDSKIALPSNFRTVIADFTSDLSITFPEYSYLWSKWSTPDVSDEELTYLFEYCVTVYPERFFDFLYQNNEIFNTDSIINTTFLPNVDFKLLFNGDNVSETIQKTLWKYLQLILFTIVGGIKDKSNFGDTMNMFDGIDETVLQEKLNETMSGITDFFKNMEPTRSEEFSSSSMKEEFQKEASDSAKPDFENMFKNMPNMPNMENMQDHLRTLFNGKIGSLAKEMAEEISGEFTDLLGEDVSNIQNTGDVIKKLMKNPKKIMDLMKTVSSKLDSKLKSGEISREEIMKEAGDLLGKMKDMGGQDQFNDMFKNLAKNMGGMGGLGNLASMAGLGNLGKNMKIDTNALERMTKQETTRSRMKAKLDIKKQQQLDAIEKLKEQRQQQVELQTKLAANYSLESTQSPNNFVFRLDGENTQEKSFIHPDLLAEMENEPIKKSKSNTTQDASQNKKKKKGKK